MRLINPVYGYINVDICGYFLMNKITVDIKFKIFLLTRNCITALTDILEMREQNRVVYNFFFVVFVLL